MSSQIYQLNYDYEQQNGHFLVIQSGDTEKLTSSDLASIEVNMLKSNDIDKVLPVEIEEINFDVRLFYRITQKRMLANVLREKPLLIQELYQLLYSIISGIKNSSQYMLNEHNFILNDEFIFVEDSLDQVYLTYLPLTQVSDKPSLQKELKDLLIRLVGHVKELSGDGVQQLMNELDQETFNLATFEILLNNLRKKNENRSVHNQQTSYTQQSVNRIDHSAITPPVRTQEPIDQKDLSADKVVNNKHGHPQSNPPQKKSQVKQQGSPAKEKPKQTNDGSNDKDDSAKQEKGKPNLLVTIVLTGFVVIATWKLFEMNPSSTLLGICIVLNILTIAGGVFYYLYKKNGGINLKSKPKKEKKEKKEKKSKKKNKQSTNKDEQIENEQERSVPVTQPKKHVVDEEQYFKNLRNETTVLSADQGTVLLNEAAAVQEGPHLEINRDNGPERIMINKDHFTIGRNPNGTDYIEKAVGISRLHFEIKINNEQYSLKDLGSKNGTKLNGESLIPYKVYALQDGDEITAGKATYSFKGS